MAEVQFGVFNTDRVNRQNICIPIEVLTESIEQHARRAVRKGHPLGTPSNIAHDMTRPYGWATYLGIHIAADMARHVGRIDPATSPEEKSALGARIDAHWREYHHAQVQPVRAELESRLAPLDLTGAQPLNAPLPCLHQPGIAAALYPEFFDPSSSFVDKDGLVDYRALLLRAPQVLPGVFHEPKRDVLLIAHPFFRRSQSRMNSLNDPFLGRFALCAAEQPELDVRIRLDPDLVGHRTTGRGVIELEYWRGPKFDGDISAIPSGVAEHKASAKERFYERIDRTQLWWKDTETRRTDGGEQLYRTFEAEELVEDPSAAIGDRFGCRYVHAEYSASEKAITHFDGAFRIYESDTYLERIEASIDRAGKRSDYLKIFRIDGQLSVEAWKALTCDFFRGNRLLGEYFGAPDEEAEDLASAPSAKVAPASAPRLAVSVGFRLPSDPVSMAHGSEAALEGALVRLLNGRGLSAVEAAPGALESSVIDLGQGDAPGEAMRSACFEFSNAIRQDVEAGLVQQVALTFQWPWEGLAVTFAVAGEAALVAQALERAASVVRPQEAPSVWIAAVQADVEALSDQGDAKIDFFSSMLPSGQLVCPVRKKAAEDGGESVAISEGAGANFA